MNNKEVYQLWIDAWNKDDALVESIVDENCIVHQARMDGADSERLKGPDALKEMITSAAAYFDDYQMSLVVGPIEEGSYVSARWNFTGSYNGKMKGATVDEGAEISFYGTDIFHMEDGRITDYWVSSDGVDFMAQLGMM